MAVPAPDECYQHDSPCKRQCLNPTQRINEQQKKKILRKESDLKPGDQSIVAQILRWVWISAILDKDSTSHDVMWPKIMRMWEIEATNQKYFAEGTTVPHEPETATKSYVRFQDFLYHNCVLIISSSFGNKSAIVGCIW